MDSTEIALKSAGPPGSSYINSQPKRGQRSGTMLFVDFMLAQPEPADLVEDVRAANAAMEEPGPRIPYGEVRRQLGLE